MYNDQFELREVFTHKTSTHSIQIRWTRVGNLAGPPIVFIHGTPWSSVVWHDLASALASHYCVYLYDHPGFRLSPQPHRQDGKEADLDPSLTLRAEASAALFQHWNLAQDPHLVAHDNGGLVSLRLIIEHKLKAASLCLMDVVAMGPFGSPFFELVANNLTVFQALPADFNEGFARSYIKSATHKPLDHGSEELLLDQWMTNGSQGPRRFLQEMIQAHNRATGEIESRYSEVGAKLPVKIIWGANDTWLPKEKASVLYEALNARELVLVDNAAHLIQYDQPSRLVFELSNWLGKL